MHEKPIRADTVNASLFFQALSSYFQSFQLGPRNTTVLEFDRVWGLAWSLLENVSGIDGGVWFRNW